MANNVPEGAVEAEGAGGGFIAYPRADLEELANDAPSELSDAFGAIQGDDPNTNAEQKINDYLSEQCGTKGLRISSGLLVMLR
ncbi:MAG: hypothetical protein ACRDWD_05290 [Acidimicrobiia bacterium]